MKRRFFLILFGLGLVIAVLAWQIPAILRAMPSRYVARLPEPIQALGEREHVELLPTAAVTVASTQLLVQVAPPAVITLAPSLTATPVATLAVPAGTIPTVLPSPVPTASPTPLPIAPAGRLNNITHQFQTWNNCGPATLAMSLSYFGLRSTQNETAAFLKPDPEDRNVTPNEMAAYVNTQTELAAITRANGNLDTLRQLIAAGFPVIVEIGIDPPGEYSWMGWYGHYLLVVAYDDASQEVWLYDSWFGTSDVPGANADSLGRAMDYQTFANYWEQFTYNYLVLFRPEQRQQVTTIIGQDMDDRLMWQNVLNHVLTALNEEPDNQFLWFNLGTAYNALGDYERAALAFDQAREIGLPWRMLWYQFGPFEAYYQVGRYEDVILLANVTLHNRPYFEESFYYKGLAMAALGDPAGARQNLEKAVQFNPNFTPAVNALADLNG